MSGEFERLFPEVLRSFDSASLTGSFQALGTPLVHACVILKFTNNSGSLVTLSWDGVNNHEILLPNAFVLIDIQSNAESPGQCVVPAQTQFYVKGATSTGLIYLSAYFTR